MAITPQHQKGERRCKECNRVLVYAPGASEAHVPPHWYCPDHRGQTIIDTGEPDEKDLEHAYNRARSIGLFLAEKYAREALREHPEYTEFFMGMGTWGFLTTESIDAGYWQEVSLPLMDLMERWEAELSLASEPLRFTADGPIRREW